MRRRHEIPFWRRSGWGIIFSPLSDRREPLVIVPRALGAARRGGVRHVRLDEGVHAWDDDGEHAIDEHPAGCFREIGRFSCFRGHYFFLDFSRSFSRFRSFWVVFDSFRAFLTVFYNALSYLLSYQLSLELSISRAIYSNITLKFQTKRNETAFQRRPSAFERRRSAFKRDTPFSVEACLLAWKPSFRGLL